MRRNGFTLTEILIVVVLLGLIAGFAIPNYAKSIQKAHEKDAIVNLTTIHATNLIYAAQNGGDYLIGNNQDVSFINSNLGLNIIENEVTYTYNGNVNGFTVTAQYGVGPVFKIQIDENSISTSNPCCVNGCLSNMLSCT